MDEERVKTLRGHLSTPAQTYTQALQTPYNAPDIPHFRRQKLARTPTLIKPGEEFF